MELSSDFLNLLFRFLSLNRPAQASGPVLTDLISPRHPFTAETLFFFGIHNKILINLMFV